MATCPTFKIDSNVTGLSYAEEVCAKQLPTLAEDGHDPIWFGLEPNSYDGFGGEITTLARTPISRTRQRKKGTTVDVEATASFNEDHTQNNHNRLLQGFFFAAAHEKPTTNPLNGERIAISAVTTASDRFEAASGLEDRGFQPGQLLWSTGFTTLVNNGLHLIDEVEDGYVGVTTNLANEASPPDEAMITCVGVQLATGDASITMNGNIPTLHLATAAVAAGATLSVATGENADDGDTITIGALTYTFRAAPDAAYEVDIGADGDETLENLAATINGESALTPAHPLVTAVATGDETMDITAIIAGTTGNGIDTGEVSSDFSWDGATAGGTGFSFRSLGLVEGEWVYLGMTAFTFANNQGYARIAHNGIADTDLTFDKTTWVAEAEAAGGLTIRMFVGDHIRNEPDPDDVETRYYQFERTLGDDANGTQAEYLLGAVANELSINAQTADKINLDLTFTAADIETVTGLQGLKGGDRVAALAEDAFNTGSDVVRMTMGVIDDTDSSPAATLFSYVTEAELTINNNVEPVKVIGEIGGIDVSVGNFEVGGDITVLFTSVDAISAIRNNSDVTFDMIVAKQNAGWVLDIPLLSLGDGQPDVELNQPVTLPLSISGAESEFGTTASYTAFPYLPDTAMPEA